MVRNPEASGLSSITRARSGIARVDGIWVYFLCMKFQVYSNKFGIGRGHAPECVSLQYST